MDHTLAWHYTTGEKFVQIIASGELHPATAHIPVGENPILWFSAHPYFEPTARKRVLERGGIRLLDIPELYARGRGLFRMGYPRQLLLRGQDLRSAANMKTKVWRALVKEARRQNSSPDDWWGCLESVPFESCTVEVMDKDLRWIRIPMGFEEIGPQP